jgi:single-strand DNA-binding protein
MNINNVVITGRISREIETRYTASGKAIGDFSVAVTDGFGDKEKTSFFDVTAWEKNAENIAKHFGKGDEIGIVGRLEQDQWEDKATGQKRSKVKIVCVQWSFGQKKKTDAEKSGNQPQSAANNRSQPQQKPQDDDDDGDIPF